MNELDYKEDLIKMNISKEECSETNCMDYNCKKCTYVDECYSIAGIRESSSWAESIDYGGYDSEEEFWENI